MLAPSYKTAIELGLSDKEYVALVDILYRLESGKLKHIGLDAYYRYRTRPLIVGRFNMAEWFYSASECGTVGCIGGWCDALHGTDFLLCSRREPMNDELDNLFHVYQSPKSLDGITSKQAATATRNYLTTGQARWAEVLA